MNNSLATLRPELVLPPEPKIHYYRSKIPSLLARYKSYRVAKELIEIVPLNKESFDLISFFEFAISINNDFCVINKMTTISKTHTAQIHVYNRTYLEENMHNLDTNNFSFHIKIYENFNHIEVFTKNLQGFVYLTKNDVECITFQDLNFYPNSIFGDFSDFENDSLLFQTGAYFANTKHICPRIVRSVFVQFQSDRSKIRKNKIGETEDLMEMLQSFPGYVNLIVQHTTENGYSFKIKKKYINYDNINFDEKIINSFSNFQILTRTIQHFTIMFPWAPYILENCNFIELDASFKALKPYCFCVGNCIYHNQSYPIGLTVAPTETETLYELFVRNGTKVGIDIDMWKRKPLLSDMHTSLVSFGKRFCFYHFFCQRHIMELFGTNSGLFFFVRKLLNCQTIEEYDDERFLIKDELTYLISKRKKMETFTDTFKEKCDILNIMLSGNDVDSSNMWHYSHWSIWTRKDFGVSTCSNHSEGFHGACRKMNSPNAKFLTQMSSLLRKILRHASKITSSNGKSLKTRYSNRRDKILISLKGSFQSIENFCKEKCECHKSDFLSCLYGIHVPCKHEMLTPCLDIIKSLKLDKVMIGEIIYIILDGEKEINNQVQDKYERIFIALINKFKLFISDELLLKKLITCVIDCFKVRPSECLNFKLDFNSQLIEIVDSTNTLPIRPFSKNNDDSSSTIPIIKIEKKDNDEFWLRDITSDIQKKAYKLKYETIYEIGKVYKELSENGKAIEICDYQFRQHFFERDESEILIGFKHFKIDCWANADEAMASNKLIGIIG